MLRELRHYADTYDGGLREEESILDRGLVLA
jgi:hypothetical protein